MEIRPILSALMRNKTAPLLIAAQVALTLAIISNALYIIRDRLATAARPSGADERNLFDIRFYPHRPIADVAGQQQRDLAALRAIPGVISAAWTNQVPLGRSGWQVGGLTADPEQEGDSGTLAGYYFSGDSLIDTFGLTLVEGRDFTAEEIIENDPEKERARPQVMILTRALAQKLFPGETRVVGKSFYMGGGDEAGDPLRIVGVVERLQTPGALADARGENSLIAPVRSLTGYASYAVRTEPGQAERIMAEAEKTLLALSSDRVMLGKRSFGEIREARYAGEKLMAGLLIAVTAFLLLITGSGIVGMASLWVNQRRKQIGVRRAMGARRGDIVRYFVIENLLIGSAGVVAGTALALALNDLLVRELSLARLPVDALALSMAAMWLLGLLAVLAPALRASLVPPAVATRTA